MHPYIAYNAENCKCGKPYKQISVICFAGVITHIAVNNHYNSKENNAAAKQRIGVAGIKIEISFGFQRFYYSAKQFKVISVKSSVHKGKSARKKTVELFHNCI